MIIKRLFKSFKVAFLGLWVAIKEEPTFGTGVVISIPVIIAVFCYPLSALERAIIFLTIFSVLGMEIMNTQVERTTNLIDTRYNLEIRKIKDLAAGAVLLMVMAAFIVASFILFPYIFGLK
jgi:undecaprenol kinase